MFLFLPSAKKKKEDKTDGAIVRLREKYHLDQGGQTAQVPFNDFFKWESTDNKLYLQYYPPFEDLGCLYKYYHTDTWRENNRALKTGDEIECCEIKCDLGIRSLIFKIKAPQEGLFVHNLPPQVSPGLGASYTYRLKLGDAPFYIDLDPQKLQKYQETRRLRKIEEERQQEEREKEKIRAKIKANYRRKQIEQIVRQELIDSGELFGEQPKRPPIPREIVDVVYKRDGGRCVYCGSAQNLQLDHIIPFSKGGATTLENLQLLCQKCNIEKSNKIG